MDILSKQRGGLLTFGFCFALYLATNGMMALMRAFNACYRTVERRVYQDAVDCHRLTICSRGRAVAGGSAAIGMGRVCTQPGDA